MCTYLVGVFQRKGRQAILTHSRTFYFCKNKTGYPLSKTNIMISYNSSLRLIPLMSTTGHSGKEGNASTESAEGRASELEKGGAKHVVCESESM